MGTSLPELAKQEILNMSTKKEIWCGIDVSKDTMAAAIDICPDQDLRKIPARNFSRTPAGVNELMEWTKSQSSDESIPRVLMEATGEYSRELFGWFMAEYSSSGPALLNPRQVKDFIGSRNISNKTDLLDAKCMARMGTELRPEETVMLPPEYQQLRELVRTRSAMGVGKKASDVRRQTLLKNGVAYKAEKRVSAIYAIEINKIDAAITDLVNRHQEIHETVKIMSTMPGIAQLSACTILSELGPFTEKYSRNQVSSYSGLAPRKFESGTSVNSSRISKRGSSLLRKVLYMSSMHSVKKVPALFNLHDRQTKRGKKPLTARCACMRKMIVILRSMVLNKQKFDPDFFQKKIQKAI